jgi:hypothetical protein
VVPDTVNFVEFCESKGIVLTTLQLKGAEPIVNMPIGSGKTLLIKLLKEWDDNSG